MKGANNRLTKAISLVLSGLGVGWLIGLSVSPVLHIVVTSIIALVVSAVGALAGVQDEQTEVEKTVDGEDAGASSRRKRPQVTTVPLTLVIVGLAMGSGVGVYARTNEWLSPNLSRTVARWRKTGLSEQDIYRRLFDQAYAPASAPGKSDQAAASSSREGVLFTVTSSECERFRNLEGEELRREMITGSDPTVAEFARRCKNTADLKILVEEVLCRE